MTSAMLGYDGDRGIQVAPTPLEKLPPESMLTLLRGRFRECRRACRRILECVDQQDDYPGYLLYTDGRRCDTQVVAPMTDYQLASLRVPGKSECPVIIARVRDLDCESGSRHS
jgi:hypothetical protein